jgi:hypothetical protein
MAPNPQQNAQPPPPPPPPPPPVYIFYTFTDWDDPKTMNGRDHGPPSTITTTDYAAAPTTVYVTPFAEQGSTTLPSPVYSIQPYHDDGDPHHHPPMSTGLMAAAGIVATVVFVFVLILLVLFLCRRTRKNRTLAAANSSRQMTTATEAQNVVDTRAYIKSSTALVRPTQSSPSTTPPSSSQPTQLPPIVLSTTLDHSYLTGIDTSDHVSLADSQTANSLGEEPPPPYRPRSIAPISREQSVHIAPSRGFSIRMADGMLPNYRPGNSIPTMEESMQNPFEDPDGDISDLEDGRPCLSTTAHENTACDDHLSLVSDLSYQQEPTSTHSTL